MTKQSKSKQAEIESHDMNVFLAKRDDKLRRLADKRLSPRVRFDLLDEIEYMDKKERYLRRLSDG